MKAGIYLRISKDHAGESLGVQRQEDEIRELADRLGWDVFKVYVDNDLSATKKGVVRPAYQQMLDDMRNRRIGGVLGWIPDRIYRQPVELEELITIADENDIQFATVKAGSIDLSTSSGRLVARILGAAAKHEIEIKSERQVAQKKQAARLGIPNPGGARPFGWKDDRITIDPFEADVIRQAVQMVLSGQSLQAITQWLHEQNIPTQTGAVRWYANVIKRILVNPRLAGHSTYMGEIVGTGRWEPILDDATWRRVVARLTRSKVTEDGTARRAGGVSLFVGGLIRCTCGYTMLSNSQPRNSPPRLVRIYACREKFTPGRPGYGKSCGAMSIKADFVEDDVVERLMATLLKPRNQARLAAASVTRDDVESRALHDLARIEEQIRENAEDRGNGIVSRTEFLAVSARLTDRLNLARQALTVTDAPRVPTGSAIELVRWWDDASLHQRRALVESQISGIIVGKREKLGAPHDPERVKVTWR